MNRELVGLSVQAHQGLRARILVLRSQPLFKGLDDDGFIRLAEHARSTIYREGEVLTREGDPTRALHIVLEGEVHLFMRELALGVFKAGSAFGAFHVLAHERAPLAVATEFTRTLEVPASAFETALDENYSLLRGTLRAVAVTALSARGNLPIDPNLPQEFPERAYYEQSRTMVERLMELRAGSFGYMNLEALVDLARRMTEVRYPAGHVLWTEGDVADHSLHIDCGRVRCSSPDGRHVDIGSNFTMGVLEIWGSHRRVYTARTETPVIAFRVDFESFLTLLEVHVEVGLQIIRGFARAYFDSRGAQAARGDLGDRNALPTGEVYPSPAP